MKRIALPDVPIIDGQARVRLSNRAGQIGVQTGFPLWGMMLFSLPFLAAGVWVFGMGSGWIEVDTTDLHAPMWVLQAFGASFVAAGILILAMAGRQVRLKSKIQRQRLLLPDEPALLDYPWDPAGFSPPRWKPVVVGWAWAFSLAIFLSMFNWWAFFSEEGPMMVKVIVVFFDLILIFVWWKAITTSIHALKFGQTRLRFSQFPFKPGEWFKAEVELPPSLTGIEKAVITLRCVMEYWETRGVGKNRSRKMVHEQIWAETQEFSGAELGAWPGTLQTTFILPAGAPGTCLSAKIPIFWELEVKAAVPGVDLNQRYLVPVYRAPVPESGSSAAPA